MTEVSCPECSSLAIQPTDEPDEDGFVEYRCTDCGHYFVDEAQEPPDVPD